MPLNIKIALRKATPNAVIEDQRDAFALFQSSHSALNFASQIASDKREVTIADFDSGHVFAPGDVMRMRYEFVSRESTVIAIFSKEKPREASSYTVPSGKNSCVGYTYVVSIPDITASELRDAAKALSIRVITKQQASDEFYARPLHWEVIPIGPVGTRYQPSGQKAAVPV